MSTLLVFAQRGMLSKFESESKGAIAEGWSTSSLSLMLQAIAAAEEAEGGGMGDPHTYSLVCEGPWKWVTSLFQSARPGRVRGTNSVNSWTIACPFSSTVILKAVGIYIWDIGDSAQFPSDAGTQLALGKLADWRAKLGERHFLIMSHPAQ